MVNNPEGKMSSRYNTYIGLFLATIFFCVPHQADAQAYPFADNLKKELKRLQVIYQDSMFAVKARTGAYQNQVYKYAKEASISHHRILGVAESSLRRSIADQAVANELILALHDFDSNIRKLDAWIIAYRVSRRLGNRKVIESLWDRYKSFFNENKNNAAWYETILKKEIIKEVLIFREKKNDYTAYLYTDNALSKSAQYLGTTSKPTSFSGFRARQYPATSEAGITGGGSIPADEIAASYPLNGQFNFYPHELNRYEGFITFREHQAELMDQGNGNSLWAKWKNTKDEVLYTAAIYDLPRSSVFFILPVGFLEAGDLYEMSLVKTNPLDFDPFFTFYSKYTLAELIDRSIWHLELERERPAEAHYFKAYFRTSIHQKLFYKFPLQTFRVKDAATNSYHFVLDEPLGPEEVFGLHGLDPMGQFSFEPAGYAKKALGNIYNDNLSLFLSHPNTAYIQHLASVDSLYPKIDSIVDIEFLPFRKRRYKYRHIKYQKIRKKTGYTSNNELIIPPYPENEVEMEYINVAPAVMAKDFKEKRSLMTKDGEINATYILPQFASEIHPKLKAAIRKRKQEYSDLLQRLDHMKGRLVKYSGGTYEAALTQILPKEVELILNAKDFAIPSGKNLKFGVFYGLPGKAAALTSTNKKILSP